MNAIVKVFIFFNLMLSVFYCALQMVLFTARDDWKGKFSEVNESYQAEKKNWGLQEKDLKDQIETLLTSLDNKKAEARESLAKVEELQGIVDHNKSTVKATEHELQEKRAKLSLLDENRSKRIEELSDTRSQLAKARESAEMARASEISFREQIVAYERERSKLRGDLDLARSSIEAQEQKIVSLEREMALLEERGLVVDGSIQDETSLEAPIHAKVLAIRPDVDIVLLSAGRDDLVKEGFQFTVFQGGTYKGKVIVESVYPNMCSARIVADLMAQSETIVEGDSASTRVY